MMMVVKTILKYAVMGAATTIGSAAARKGIDVASDPVKKAAIKRKFENIKAELQKKKLIQREAELNAWPFSFLD